MTAAYPLDRRQLSESALVTERRPAIMLDDILGADR
jgi:hypothetical protein